MKHARLLPILVLAACTTPPRTSTIEERAFATETLTLVETAIVAASLTGKVPAEDVALANRQLQELRDLVASSEHTPTSWSSILSRVTLLAAAWIVAKD